MDDATRDGGPIVGIDLGTTNSLVAYCDEAGPRVLAGEGDAAIVPSVVRYEREGSTIRAIVGDDAKARAVEFPRTTVSSVKRLMGRSVGDAAADLPYLSYEVVEGEHATARVALPLEVGAPPHVVSPQEVSAEILRALRTRAEGALGVAVRRAVVTVPAYFDDAQRQATRDAGRIAGLEVVRIVNEPTAAALAYGLGLERAAGRNREPEVVAVYDLGGGTFDVSILRVIPGQPDGQVDGEERTAGGFYQVLATAGDTRLGGDDVDQRLVRLFLAEMGVAKDAIAGLPPETRRALTRFAQDVKHRLSAEESASVRIETGSSEAYERTVSREELDGMMSPWVDRTISACERAMRDATSDLAGEGVSRVVLVGGSTRVPLVRRAAGAFFGVEPYSALDPDTVVALGAAVQGDILRRARGGTGGGPGGGRASSLLLDVIPLSLGIETRGGAVAKLIVRNSAVPAKAVETFTTSEDNQTGIELNVVQGEREMASDCRSLGQFALRGLPPMPAGVPQLEVEFLVDANGVLRVSAQEKRSGKRMSVQIVPNHGLTEAEVDRMEAESLEHAADDMTRHRVVDLVENGRLDLKWIGERLEKHRGELDRSYAGELDGKIGRLQGLVDAAAADWRSVDANELASAKDDLDRASVRLQEVGIAASLRADERGDAGR